jgi:sec-independent protein translocase protein TatB
MFDVAPSELLLIAIVAIVVIGPKDLPRALYKLGQFVGKGKAMARHFRTGVDAMIREAELEDLQKQWAKENEAIMAQYPSAEIAAEMKPLAEETATELRSDQTNQPAEPVDPAQSPKGAAAS